MKRVLRGFAWLVATTVVLQLIGWLMARRIESGGPESDEASLAAIWGGREFRSTAGSLRSLKALVMLGGMNIDLTGATLQPEGAAMHLDVRLGGVNIRVPPGWHVDVADQMRAGGVSLQVPLSTDDAAPDLSIMVRGWAGGVNVEAGH